MGVINMKKLSNSALFKLISKLLILLALAKIISLVFLWLLPNSGVELQLQENYKHTYQRIDFQNMLSASHGKRKTTRQNNSYSESISITNMILKGLYGKGPKGVAVVALKSLPKKTSLISVGEVFEGYTLKSILENSVIFTKFSKEYTLKIDKLKQINSSAISFVQTSETLKEVSRKDIDSYINDEQQLHRDISVNPLRDGNRLKGFKVLRIRKNSKMDTLGLKKNDVIISANNVELKSYKDVMDIYENVKKLTTLQLIVIRDNQEKELIYEIN